MTFLRFVQKHKKYHIPPKCHLRYYELVDKYSKEDHQALVDHVKDVIAQKILQETKINELPEVHQSSLNLITWENVAAFLLGEDGCELFHLCTEQDWPFVKACESVTQPGQIAFVVDISYSSWKSKDWEASPLPEGVPFHIPDTEHTRGFLARLRRKQATGYLVENQLVPTKDYFHKFRKRERRWMKREDGWYSSSGRKIKQPKRAPFTYLSWPHSVCNLIFYFFVGLY